MKSSVTNPAGRSGRTMGLVPDALAAVPPEVVSRLEHLIEIARLLASFETVEQTFHSAIAVAARILPLDSAILLELDGENSRRASWTPGANPLLAEPAQAHAESVFAYLAGRARELPPPSRSRRYIALPLVVAGRPLFGVLQMEGIAFDREDLGFINAIANQFAVAIDRDRAWRSDIARRDQAERLELELRAQAEALVAADRQRSEFLSVLADELRGSLAVSRQVQASLRSAAGHDRFERDIRNMNAQIQQTAQLIEDLHGLAQLTLEDIELRRKRIDLSALVARAGERGRELLAARGQALTLSSPCLPAWAEGDAARVEQVLDTLIDKASLLAAPGGRIWLSARLLSDGDGEPAAPAGPQIAVTLRDDGAGTVKAVLPRVFDLLNIGGRRIDPNDARFESGLKLVRRIVELHGGSVSATSAGVGQGSEFELRLPVDNRPYDAIAPERRST